MAQVPEMYSGMFGISPDVNPAYLQLPQTNVETPIPYSPEGWNASRVASPSGLAAPTGPSAASGPTPQEEKKAGGVGFTPEQAAALGKLMSVDHTSRMPAGGFAPKSQVGQMQQLSVGPSGAGPKRQSLGNILYGRG